MESFKRYISEHMINIGFNKSQELDREKHRQEIHDMLKFSYRHIGYGGQKINSPEESEAIHNDISHALIKATRRKGKLTAVALYKPTHGRKQIAGGTDGSIQGKKDWLKLAHDDHVNQKTAPHRNAWIEASGGSEKMMRKLGSREIPVSTMKKLLPNKDIQAAPEKGEYAYRRTIGIEKHTKTGFGNPRI